ncbi:ABC transporter ATP-binding protein [uncultured Croceitalea sp.]|uniref:ABC transporter ATP-binding protein n=1 Tax=uncultured Croceitalea sp. TaxID=1798908 RepID=UPI0033056AB5
MLEVNNASFSYQDNLVLEDVSFSLKRGQHLSIMGESGSGKSTLLKAIYGLLHLSEGTIHWDKAQVLGPNFNLVPGEKYMKYVSQSFDLMPFTTVRENIAEHLSVFEQDTHEERTNELLKLIELVAYADTKVKNLSGGQMQRVALARALAQEPEVLLLDEPFSSIDQFKKNDLRFNLFPYLKEKGITVLTATHDPNDVLPFSDELLVLRNGHAIAHDKTEQLYKNPKKGYIASLFDLVNEIPVSLLRSNNTGQRSVLVYPHELEVTAVSGFEVFVIHSYFQGNHYLIEGLTAKGLTIRFNHSERLEARTKALLNVSASFLDQRL